MFTKFGNTAKAVSLASTVSSVSATAHLQQTPSTELGAFQLTINSATMLPELSVRVSKTGGTSTKEPMLISLNATQSVFWSESCVQNLSGTQLPCSEAPTYTQNYFTTLMNQTDSPLQNYTTPEGGIDGYSYFGQTVFSKITIFDAFDATGSATGVSNELTIGAINGQEITGDAWLYNVNQGSIGTIGLGIGSDLWWNSTQTLIDPVLNAAAFQISTGPVNSWTAFGYTGPLYNSTLNIGQPTNFAPPTTLWNISTDSSQSFSYATIGFGQNLTATPSTSNYFVTIQDNTVAQNSNMTFALDSQGLILPLQTYQSFTSLLVNYTTLTPQFVSNSCQSGYCTLTSSCGTYAQELLTLQFSFDVSTSDNAQPILTIPLANFAVTNAQNQCQLYVQSTPSGFNPNTVVLGTMVIQSLNMSFTYNYTTIGIPTTQGQYYASGTNIVAFLSPVILNNTQMTASLGQNGPNPFWQQQSLVLNTGLTMSTQEILMPYIGVDFLSTNPSGVYLLDLAASQWVAFSPSCTFTMSQTQAQESCGNVPVNVNPSFPQQAAAQDEGLIAGYQGFGQSFPNQAGTINVTNGFFGQVQSTLAVDTFVFETIQQDNWLQSSPVQISGVVGLGSTSGVWNQPPLQNPYPNLSNLPSQLAVGLMNMTDWTDFNVVSYSNQYQSTITGGFNVAASYQNIVQLGTPHTSSPLTFNSTYNTLEIGLSNLAFGINYNNGSAFNQSILTNATQQTAILALDFVGLGLNNDSYIAFADMLYLISNSQFDCSIQTPTNNVGVFQSTGSCVAPQACSAYPNLWSYSFNVTFEGQTNYLTVPLATFAQSFNNTSDQTFCQVHVQYTNMYENNVVLGAMFFQQFFALFQTAVGSTQFSQVNFYQNNQVVLPGTYLGSAPITSITADPFVVTPRTPTVATTPTLVPAPAFSLTVGIQATPGNYLIDFSSPNLYVWDVQCQFNGQSCALAPVYAVQLFSNQTQAVGAFTGLWTGGYQVSGNIFIEQVVESGSYTRLVRVYDVTTILQNTWNNGVNTQTAGVVGLSGSSPFVSQFIGLDNVLQYSIIINQTPLTSNQIAGSATVITLGPGDQSAYAGQPSVTVPASLLSTSQAENFVYILSAQNSTPSEYGLGFGVLNQTNSSWYYETLLTDGNVTASLFSTSYSGLGLSAGDFATFSTLLFNATNGTFQCSSTNCYSTTSCAVNSQNLTELSFQIRFSKNSSNYLIMPLASLAVTNPANGYCELLISVPIGSDADQTLFGSQFFSNFFGSFETTDPTGANAAQVMTLYQIPNLGTQAQISNATYAIGENPFYTSAVIPTPTPPVPPTPTPPEPTGTTKLETIFIIIFVIIVLIVVAAVGYTCYNKYKKKQQQEDAAAFVYANKSSSVSSQQDLLA